MVPHKSMDNDNDNAVEIYKKDSGNGWDQYKKWVEETLKEMKVDIKEIKAMQVQEHTEMSLLKLKSSMWGGLAGLGTYAIMWTAEFLKRRP
jgi:hypothetical protein